LTGAPAGLAEQLFEAFHLHAVYSKEHRQVTIRVTITDTTPDAVARLRADTRITPAKMREHAFEEADPALSYSSHDQRGRAKLPKPRFRTQAAMVQSQWGADHTRGYG
jgi:hypothetical protein